MSQPPPGRAPAEHLRAALSKPIAGAELTRDEVRREPQPIVHKDLKPVVYVFGDLAGERESPVYALDALDALGALARIEPRPTPSAAAIAAHLDDPGWQASSVSPFTSAARASAATFTDRGSWRLGAPDALLPSQHPVVRRAEELAGAGLRVLLLDSDCGPVALVGLRERVRPEAEATIAFFAAEGAFFLRSLGLVALDQGQWDAVFDDILALL